MSGKAARSVLLLVLGGFYLAGATEHARSVNTFKARGDQSGYLGDAENVYANWHGRNPPVLIGERNRMPLYAGFLALFYRPSISDSEFFEIGKRWNIYLSLMLLGCLYLIFARFLPPIPAINLLVIVAFGYFVFKAGYTQSELLFYFLLFAAFALMLVLLWKPLDLRGVLWRAAAAGAIAGLAQLTKAAMLPLVAMFLAASVVDTSWSRSKLKRRHIHGLIAAVVMAVAFLATLSPYLTANKRAFGRYFYNVNTTFYMWYDNWPQASVGTIKHGDGVGWPDMPNDELPGAARYWREHRVGQIAARVANGLWDMVDRSYKTYWYFKYVSLYTVFALVLAVTRRADALALVRRHPGACAFLGVYLIGYLLGIAFYEPVSGTGTTRFLLAHVLPYLFVLSLAFTRPTFRNTEWTLAGVRVTPGHFHLLVSATLAFDLIFTLWPRLMTTYGGF